MLFIWLIVGCFYKLLHDMASHQKLATFQVIGFFSFTLSFCTFAFGRVMFTQLNLVHVSEYKEIISWADFN